MHPFYLCISVCGAHCKTCQTNGALLCDPNSCDDTFVYNATTKSCAGKWYNMTTI